MFSFPRLNPSKLLYLDSAYILTIDGEPVAVRVKVKSGYYDFAISALRFACFPVHVLFSEDTPTKLPRVALYPLKGSKSEYISKREQGLGRKSIDYSSDNEMCRLISFFLHAWIYQVNEKTLSNYPVMTEKGNQLFLNTFLPNHRKVLVGDNGRIVRLGVTFYDPEQRSLGIFVRLQPSDRLYYFNFSLLHRFLSASDQLSSYSLSIVR